jgi:hypothetical protein
VTPLLLLTVTTTAAAAVGRESDGRFRSDCVNRQADVWIQTGVLDEAERGRYFVADWNLTSDLDAMRERAAALTPTTPPYSDLYRLPSKGYARQSWTLCVRYGRYLDWLYPWCEPGEKRRVDNTQAELEWRQRVWALIDDIHGGWRREGPRLLLAQLRDLVGDDAYYAGDWPDPLPAVGYRDAWHDPEPEAYP